MDTLDSLFAATATELRCFLEALATEKTALIAGEAQRLPELAAEKSALAERLAAIETRRAALLQSLGLPASRAGVEAWLAQQPATASSHALWQEILALAAQARQANELNGALIGTQLQQTHQALSVLLSQATATTYDASGQQQPAASRRPLGSA